MEPPRLPSKQSILIALPAAACIPQPQRPPGLRFRLYRPLQACAAFFANAERDAQTDEPETKSKIRATQMPANEAWNLWELHWPQALRHHRPKGCCQSSV